jgi:Ca2+-binding RTX toxin-like protein
MANSGFETGNFTDWKTIGDASIQTADFGVKPTEGQFQALVTSGEGSVSDAELENSLGLAPGSLDGLGKGEVTEGSALQFVPITVKAGEVLSFDWNFLTIEETPSSFNDLGFVSISSVAGLGDTNSKFVLSDSPLLSETGYGKFSYEFTSAGTYVLSLGVADVGDSVVDSGLLIDNLKIFNPLNIVGTSGNDVLVGSSKNDTISGLGGNDNTIGQAGNDLLLGGLGDDWIIAGSGRDSVDGGAGADQISGQAGNDTLNGNDNNDVIFGGDNEDIINGGRQKDRLFGDKGNDTIFGGDDNDNINGGDGRDRLFGENGNDNLFGGLGNDLLSGGKGNDRLNGEKNNDTLNGDRGNDYLFGDVGGDLLVGGEGNDTLIGTAVAGGSEIDILTGGTGKDLFVLGNTNTIYYGANGSSNYGIITDFKVNEDLLQLKESAQLYNLELFTSGAGVTDAYIYRDLGSPIGGDLIAIVQNVKSDFNLIAPNVTYV